MDIARPKPTAWHLTTVKISPEFAELARKHHIKFSDAMRTGLSMMFAEKGLREYDNKLNIYRKMQNMRIMAEQSSQKAFELEAELARREGINIQANKREDGNTTNEKD